MSTIKRSSAFSCAALGLLAAVTISRPAIADWPDVGASAKPSWVDGSAERRLRLLPALPPMKDAVQSQVKGYFGTQGPGMSVGLVLGDELGLFYSQGFGFADADLKTTPDEYTIYRTGSFSKVITGTALLTLINDPARQMSLTDNADQDRYLPELKFVCPDFNKTCDRGHQSPTITLQNLVSHTAGLADVMVQDNATVCPWLDQLKKSWVIFKPGDFNAYSGVSVEGVGLIEQRIAKKPYVDFVNDSVFTPLGMTHSSMDQTKLPQSWLAQKWNVSWSNQSGFSFTKANLLIDGDAPPIPAKACEANHGTDLIDTAGGYATNVRDHSLFMNTWLLKDMPDGKPFLSSTLMDQATKNLFPDSGLSQPSSCAGVTDQNGFGYSPCGSASAFGVNWAIEGPRFVEHNGSEGVSGSETGLNFATNMGATALISTDPGGPFGGVSTFVDGIAFNTLLNQGEAADAATNWSGKRLPIGVARVLYLSGKTPAASDLGNFTDSFIAANLLNSTNIVAFLNNWHQQVGACSNFRIRAVENYGEITVRFYCKQVWDVVLNVDDSTAHKISWAAASQANVPTPQDKCIMGCEASEESCMSGAHSFSNRQACVIQVGVCQKTCK